MRKKFTNDSQQRKRVSLDVSKPVLTDQSSKNMSDINNIMLQYQKTGLLPVQQEKVAQYIDNTLAMPLEQAHELIRDARTMFAELPAPIRKLMDNDPTNLVSFLNDSDNKEILIKHGVIEEKNQLPEIETSPKSDPDAVKQN